MPVRFWLILRERPRARRGPLLLSVRRFALIFGLSASRTVAWAYVMARRDVGLWGGWAERGYGFWVRVAGGRCVRRRARRDSSSGPMPPAAVGSTSRRVGPLGIAFIIADSVIAATHLRRGRPDAASVTRASGARCPCSACLPQRTGSRSSGNAYRHRGGAWGAAGADAPRSDDPRPA